MGGVMLLDAAGVLNGMTDAEPRPDGAPLPTSRQLISAQSGNSPPGGHRTGTIKGQRRIKVPRSAIV